MEFVVALAGLIYCVAASPVVIVPNTRPVPRPVCPNTLCFGIIDQANYPLLSTDPVFANRCFFSCILGVATCQCCNDDGTVYNPFCDTCVWPADQNKKVCPTTAATVAFANPCTQQRSDQATAECRNLVSFFGAAYDKVDGDYPFVVRNPDNSVSTLSGLYASCVGGIVGYCRFCPPGLVWKVVKDNGVEKTNCGFCDWP